MLLLCGPFEAFNNSLETEKVKDDGSDSQLNCTGIERKELRWRNFRTRRRKRKN